MIENPTVPTEERSSHPLQRRLTGVRKRRRSQRGVESQVMAAKLSLVEANRRQRERA